MDGLDLIYYGVYPRKVSGLIGILTSSLIHGNENLHHIIDNSIPLFFLSLAVFYFYNKVAYRVFFLIYFCTGIAVWFFARSAYHIGASGLIYGLASFLFFSGVIRQNINLLAISLLVVFLYGSMVWGIFPYDINVSWEAHFFGAVTGLILSFRYRKEGPQIREYKWEDEGGEENGKDEGESYEDDMRDIDEY